MTNWEKLDWRLTVPNYDDFQRMTVENLMYPSNADFSCVELGLGSGNTTLEIIKQYPEANIIGVDQSTEVIKKVKNLTKNHNITFTQSTFEDYDFPKNINVIFSSLSLHHLTTDKQLNLFERSYKSLTNEGVFVISDLFRIEHPFLQKMANDLFMKNRISKLSQEQMEAFTRHCLDDSHHFCSLNKVRHMLRVAGFEHIDVVWSYYSLAVVRAVKVI